MVTVRVSVALPLAGSYTVSIVGSDVPVLPVAVTFHGRPALSYSVRVVRRTVPSGFFSVLVRTWLNVS